MPQTALAEFYARQAPRARHLAYLLTGDRLLAEDLVQDCFVKLAGRLRPVEDPEAYLRRMVVNASHSHHRKLRVRRDRARDEALTIGADTDTSPTAARPAPHWPSARTRTPLGVEWATAGAARRRPPTAAPTSAPASTKGSSCCWTATGSSGG